MYVSRTISGIWTCLEYEGWYAVQTLQEPTGVCALMNCNKNRRLQQFLLLNFMINQYVIDKTFRQDF